MAYRRLKGSLTFLPAVFIFILVISSASAQSVFKGLEPLFTIPKNYVVYHTGHPPVIDGDITEPVWQKAKWTSIFKDIEGEGKPRPVYPTKVKMLWDDSCLYIAAKITEPNVWATLTNHDDIVFHDNDFEVFIDPIGAGQPYYEIEVNALNTIFDLMLKIPYRDGGSADIGWNVKGLRSAVKVQGTINDPSDKDKGWTVEMAIPFKSMALVSGEKTPMNSETWRINFSRVEWDTKVINGKYVKLTDSAGKTFPEHNWVWSPQGVINMHYPERWGNLKFSREKVNSDKFHQSYGELQKQYLWLIYYREHQWFDKHQAYALSLRDLGVPDSVIIKGRVNKLTLDAKLQQFTAWIEEQNSIDMIDYSITQQGLGEVIVKRSQ
jgi:hypothetical protein